MRKLFCCTLLTLAVGVIPTRAGVVVRTPWVCIHVGSPAPTQVLVQTPWVSVDVSPPVPLRPVAAPASLLTEPAYVPGEPPPVPLPIPVEVAVSRAPTLNEFAATFKPKGGRYEVEIEHPVTGKPVRVSFTLPEGTPKRVKIHRRELDFEYRGKEVSIRFVRGGEVRVRD